MPPPPPVRQRKLWQPHARRKRFWTEFPIGETDHDPCHCHTASAQPCRPVGRLHRGGPRAARLVLQPPVSLPVGSKRSFFEKRDQKLLLLGDKAAGRVVYGVTPTTYAQSDR